MFVCLILFVCVVQVTKEHDNYQYEYLDTKKAEFGSSESDDEVG